MPINRKDLTKKEITMDEYVSTVLMAGETKPTELKNVGTTPEEVIDNIVQIDGVNYLYHIRRLKDDAVWDFDADLKPLREIRELITQASDVVGLQLSIKETGEEDETKLH